MNEDEWYVHAYRNECLVTCAPEQHFDKLNRVTRETTSVCIIKRNVNLHL